MAEEVISILSSDEDNGSERGVGYVPARVVPILLLLDSEGFSAGVLAS